MKIYLSSPTTGMTKSDFQEAITKNRPLYLLETFFTGEKQCSKVMEIVGRDGFILDSGAFSYMNGAEIDIEQMAVYMKRYINFIKESGIRYYFEMDVDKLFGLKQVEEWRSQLEKETGVPCIPVWHKNRGVEYWKRMCHDYSYVAIGGLVLDMKRQEFPLVRQMVDYAYNRGVKVHGLGFTRTKELPQYKFYSVDSSSWTVGAVWAQQRYFFKDGYMQWRSLKQENKKTNISKLIACNMGEWIKYQKFADSWRY